MAEDMRTVQRLESELTALRREFDDFRIEVERARQQGEESSNPLAQQIFAILYGVFKGIKDHVYFKGGATFHGGDGPVLFTPMISLEERSGAPSATTGYATIYKDGSNYKAIDEDGTVVTFTVS